MKNKDKLTFEEYIQRENKRMALFCSVWAIIGMPFVFLFDQNLLDVFVLFIYMPYIFVGLRIAPYAVKRIWKD